MTVTLNRHSETEHTFFENLRGFYTAHNGSSISFYLTERCLFKTRYYNKVALATLNIETFFRNRTESIF